MLDPGEWGNEAVGPCPIASLANASCFEVNDALALDPESFSLEKCRLQVRRAAVAANPAARCHHAVIGEAGNGGRTHDVAGGPSGTRAPGSPRQIAIRDHAPRRDPSEQSEHAAGERRRCRPASTHAQRRTTSGSTQPSAFGMRIPTIAARVGAMSAGVAGLVYRPGRMPAPKKMMGTRRSYSYTDP